MEYYVNNQSGNNGNPGTEAQPWATLAYADDQLSPGDTLHIHYGTGVYNEQLRPNSGVVGDYITIQAYGLDTPRIHVANGTCVNLQDRHHIKLMGLTIGATVQSGTAPLTGIHLHGADYIEITDCEIAYGKNNSYSRGITDDWGEGSGCTYVTISGCSVHDWGTPGGQEPDLGECVKIHDYSDHILVEDNMFYSAGHVAFAIFADTSVIRGNTIYNTGFNKCAAFWGWAGHRMVIEDNDIYESDQHEGTYANGGIQMGVPQGIFRNNRIWSCIGTGLDMYHQTNYHSTDSRIYNNTFYNNGTGNGGGNSGYATSISQSTANPDCTGITWKNNIFYDDYREGVGYRDLSDPADHSEITNWETSDGDPLFTDAQNGNFTLQAGSPCISVADPLTTVRDPGSGNVIPVVDSYYFSDGFGLVQGDTVFINNDQAIITNIDYANHNLTIDRILSVGQGDGIYMSDDIGAYETEPTPPSGETMITIKLNIIASSLVQLVAVPTVQNVKQGESTSYQISATGQTDPLVLSIEGVPSGVTANFNPDILPVGGVVTLDIQVASDAPVGEYNMTIKVV